MKYQIGDDILVLLSNEEGKVIEIINDKMVLIEVRGVKFPAYMDQIDFPYFKRFTEKKLFPNKIAPKIYIDQIPKEKPQPNQIKVEAGVWLSFIPKFALDDFNDEVVEKLKIYLVNKTDCAYQFNYLQYFNGVDHFQIINEIPAFQDFYIHDIDFAAVNDSPSFSIEFSLTKKDKHKADHFETSLKLKPKLVFQKIETLKENNEPSFSYSLFEKYPDKAAEFFPLDSLKARGYKVYDAGKAREHLPPARSVIDLHIEKLTSDFTAMSNFEMLTLQLKELEKWVDITIAHKQADLIVIHGVGSGKLREETHEYLKTRREVKQFFNQYDSRFGYGATQVFFQYG
ncbi:MAG: hypothetical protein EAZ35_04790 [Sphingobacteriia bacterium]|nr:MAG: hypothetical protein EAZ41_06315 [Sphingobacteriia bacterium]TAG31048.1 MAG: hypothetical protein EAZ35_04790 [Sphingobacteriia bacterium]